MIAKIQWLSEWFSSQCDGNWKHEFGVRLSGLAAARPHRGHRSGGPSAAEVEGGFWIGLLALDIVPRGKLRSVLRRTVARRAACCVSQVRVLSGLTEPVAAFVW